MSDPVDFAALMQRRITDTHTIYRHGVAIVVVLKQIFEEDLWEKQQRWAEMDEKDSVAVRAADREMITAAFDHCEDADGETVEVDFAGAVLPRLTSAERIALAQMAWRLAQAAPEAPFSAPQSQTSG